MLSIIIPTMNEEKYISNLFKSLSIQDYQNFEVIIADGISSDFTMEKIEILAKNLNINIRFIQTRMRHTSKQRNIGARAAHGDKLVFIDADITLPNNNYLKKINHALCNNGSATALVKVNPNEEGVIDSFVSDFLNGWMMILNSLGLNNGRGAVIGVKKEVFHKIGGFDERAFIGEDVDLFMRMNKKPAIIKPPVYESPRRYRKSGYFKVFCSWIIDGAIFQILKKPLRKGMVPIR